MSLSKKNRQIVFDKSGGKCWYCGCDLKKGWHGDHIIPLLRLPQDTPLYAKKHFSKYEEDRLKKYDVIENIVPSCPQCNNYKHTLSLEEFRKEIAEQVSRVRKYSVNFRTAERFGLIEVKEKPVVFWFEKEKSNESIKNE